MFRQIAAWLLALTLTLGMAASAGAESGGDQALDLRFDDAGLSGAAVYQGRIILSMGYDSPKELDLATGKVSDFLGISPTAGGRMKRPRQRAHQRRGRAVRAEPR